MLDWQNISILMTGWLAQATLPESGGEFNATLVGGWAVAIGAVLSIIYGIIDKKLATKTGSQTVEKNTFDQLVEENKLWIGKVQLLRKDSDKWHLLRAIVIELPNGAAILQEVEKAADETSSTEN